MSEDPVPYRVKSPLPDHLERVERAARELERAQASYNEVCARASVDLSQARERAGLTLREAARRLGCSAPFLGDMEKGYRRCSARWIRKAISVYRNA